MDWQIILIFIPITICLYAVALIIKENDDDNI
jgi:hypothetical protein